MAADGGVREIEFMNPRTIRFSQSSVRASFREPYQDETVFSLAKKLRGGAIKATDIEPIEVVEREGRLYALGNRRLVAFQMADVEIPVVRVPYSEVLHARFFTTLTEGTSIEIRGLGIWSPTYGFIPFGG
jgi:hypothetical protein